jgi:hypothetical protein
MFCFYLLTSIHLVFKTSQYRSLSLVFVFTCVFFRMFVVIVESVPITTKVVSSSSAHGDVYSIQHYLIKFVSDLRQVGGFLRVLRYPSPIKLTATI